MAKDRRKRLDLLIRYLLDKEFDVVALQEMWIRKDYERLVSQVATKYPYHYYFKRY